MMRQRTETKSIKHKNTRKHLWHSCLVYTQNNIAFKTQPLSVIIVVLSRYIFTAFKYQIYSFTDVFTLLLTLNVPNIRDILFTLIVLFKSINFTENNSPCFVGYTGDRATSRHAQGFDRRAREGGWA